MTSHDLTPEEIRNAFPGAIIPPTRETKHRLLLNQINASNNPGHAPELGLDPCPECAGGKHPNCTGQVPAGDDYDDLIPCPCAEAGHSETAARQIGGMIESGSPRNALWSLVIASATGEPLTLSPLPEYLVRSQRPAPATAPDVTGDSGQPVGKSEGLGDAGPAPSCRSPRRQDPAPESDALQAVLSDEFYDAVGEETNIICTCDGCNYYSPTYDPDGDCRLYSIVRAEVARHLAARPTPEPDQAARVAIPRPSIHTGPNHMTVDEATYSYLREAASRVRVNRYWGSGVTCLVADVLESVATALLTPTPAPEEKS